MPSEPQPHDYAMEAAFFADAARQRGDSEKAAELFERALELELQALSEAKDTAGLWGAVLHRSAAWLALDCNQPRLAEKLACQALAGDPDPAIADQLREVLAAAQERLAKDGIFVPAELG